MPRGRPKGSKNAGKPSAPTLSKATAKNVTMTGDAAAKFLEARDKFNESCSYPFPLTTSQFAILLREEFTGKNS